MHDRVHACLDGELSPEVLTPMERAHLAAFESAIGEAVTVLCAAPVPDFTARVMQALPERVVVPTLAERAESLWSRARGWLWEPRTLVFRPAYALAGFATVALAVVSAPELVPGADQPAALVAEAVQPADAQRLYVQFRLEAPEASQVKLAGSFTGWQPKVELLESAPGVWTALVPLDPGVHDYTFVVDEQEWVADPHAPQVDDSFGGTNSRLFLPSPEGSV